MTTDLLLPLDCLGADAGSPRSGRRRRWVTATVGLGMPATAFLAAAVMGATATAPVAHADPISDIFTSVLNEAGGALTNFGNAVTDLFSLNIGGSIDSFVSSLDQDLVIPTVFITDSVQALFGQVVSVVPDTPLSFLPTDLSAYFSDLTQVPSALINGLSQLGSDIFSLNIPSAVAAGLELAYGALITFPQDLTVGLLTSVL